MGDEDVIIDHERPLTLKDIERISRCQATEVLLFNIKYNIGPAEKPNH
jgi:hypothetical protein